MVSIPFNTNIRRMKLFQAYVPVHIQRKGELIYKMLIIEINFTLIHTFNTSSTSTLHKLTQLIQHAHAMPI